MKRTFDPSFLNTVANHPGVRPHLGGEGALDFTDALANPNNVGFIGNSGGFIAQRLDCFGLYEGHSMFLQGHEDSTIDCLRELLTYLFVETDCSELITKIPEYNRGAVGLGRSAGFRTLFERENAWDVPGGSKCKVSYASLPFARWVATDPSLPQYGKWFHTRLEQLTDGKIPEHTEEDIHNRMVGAATLMFWAGNSIKGAAFYNRWAAFAGYEPIRLINEHPAIIDMDQVVVQVRDGDMELLQCR